LIFKGRKILFISLTRTGCVEYAAAFQKKLSEEETIVMASHASKSMFSKVDIAIETYTGWFSFALRSLRIKSELKKILDNINRQHSNLTIMFPVFHPWNNIIASWANKNSVPVTSVIHDVEMHLGEGNSKIEILQKQLMQKSTWTIFLTESEKEKAINKNGVQKEKGIVIPHPLIKTKAQHKLPHSKHLKVLYLGRLKKYKGIQLLIDACREMEIEKLTIAGEGDLPLNFVDNKIELIRERLSENEMDKLIAAHHVLVLPYVQATQSGILTLGVNANIPMVITELPGLTEQLPKNAAVWCEPNVSSLKAALESLAADPETYQALKENMGKFKKQFDEKWGTELGL